MTAHDHSQIVEGCYRCELGADELDPRFDRAFVKDWDRVVLDGRAGTLTWHKSERRDD